MDRRSLMTTQKTDAASEKRFASMAAFIKHTGGTKIIQKVLIANNGIAAVKLIRSVRKFCYETFGNELAVTFVVMATPEDLRANAEYIRMADEVAEVPGGANNNNYANVSLILELAKRYNVDGVFPGWGHASENPALPDALGKILRREGDPESGIAFIGPDGNAMRALGDKIGSTIIAQSARVATIPWNGDGITVDTDSVKQGECVVIPRDEYDKANVTTWQAAAAAAERIGYPVMVKASEGGGGKGIRKVMRAEDMERLYNQAQSEIPGSPIFVMKLAHHARHLEVQLLADLYGEAISLNGRDCSVQRRHQKILEEGPPLAPPSVTWKKMQAAAVRLAKAVNYANAGTVEYLYQSDGDSFAFLELNPRLQVEHPVTEMIMGFNLPAAQLLVASGLPLHRIPDVRKLYGQSDPFGESPIDFATTPQAEPEGHVIACRITAENPDQGFQPTAGAIKELNFRSTRDVWGYFSVDSSGRVHEFADSQIGHLFAWGGNRERARRNMVQALKEFSIRGDIRTTVEYLVSLLQAEDFVANNISTEWLDRRISANVRSERPDDRLVVIASAAVQAYDLGDARAKEYTAQVVRGQLPSEALLEVQTNLELIYENVKYSLTASRAGPSTYAITVNNARTGAKGTGGAVEVEVRALSDGGRLVLLAGKSHVAYGTSLEGSGGGYRLVLDSNTCLFTDEYDPTQLKAEMAGKLARWLVEDGATLNKGQPYCELEVMKMYLSLKAPEDGAITFVKSAGSVLSPGDLLATLVLEDPSKVSKATPFEGAVPPELQAGSSSSDQNALRSSQARDAAGSFFNPHYALRDATNTLGRVLAGFAVGAAATREALETAVAACFDPRLPLLELQEALSVLVGRLPPALDSVLHGVVKQYQTLLSDATQKKEDTSTFVRLVLAVPGAIEGYLADSGLPDRERLATHQSLAPLLQLAGKYATAAPGEAAAGAGLEVRLAYETCGLLREFIETEAVFERYKGPAAAEEIVWELRRVHADAPERVFQTGLSHAAWPRKCALVQDLLKTLNEDASALSSSTSLKSKLMPAAVKPKLLLGVLVPSLRDLAALNHTRYAAVALLARQLLIQQQSKSTGEVDRIVAHRLREYAAAAKHGVGVTAATKLAQLVDAADVPDVLDRLARVVVGAGGPATDAATSRGLRSAALTSYVSRIYRPYEVIDIAAVSAADTAEAKLPTAPLFLKMRFRSQASSAVAFGVTPAAQAQSPAAEQGDKRTTDPSRRPTLGLGLKRSPSATALYKMAGGSGGVLSPGLDGGFESDSSDGGAAGSGGSGGLGGEKNEPVRAGVVACCASMAELNSCFAGIIALTKQEATEAASADARRRHRSRRNVLHFILPRATVLEHVLRHRAATTKAEEDLGAAMGMVLGALNAETASGPVTEEEVIAVLGEGIKAVVAELENARIGRVTFLVVDAGAGSGSSRELAAQAPDSGAAQDSNAPSLYTFRMRSGKSSKSKGGAFAEDQFVRHIEPPLAFHLELARLSNFKVATVHGANAGPRNIHIFEATPREQKRGQAGVARFFVRAMVRQFKRLELGAGDLLGGTTALPRPPAGASRKSLMPVPSGYTQQELDSYPDTERVFVQALDALEGPMTSVSQSQSARVVASMNNHIFLNILPCTDVEPEFVVAVMSKIYRRYRQRIVRLRVATVEVKFQAEFGGRSEPLPLRLVASDPTGYNLQVDIYVEAQDQLSGEIIFTQTGGSSGGRGLYEGLPVTTPYPVSRPLEDKRNRAVTSTGTVYCYDLLPLFDRALRRIWRRALRNSDAKAGSGGRPRGGSHGKATELGGLGLGLGDLGLGLGLGTDADLIDGLDASMGIGIDGEDMMDGESSSMKTPGVVVDAVELVLKNTDVSTSSRSSSGPVSSAGAAGSTEGVDEALKSSLAKVGLAGIRRPPGLNDIGMVAWLMTLFTPECKAGRRIVVIANDITHKAGSFGTREDALFDAASKFARQELLPRVYVAANSGARIGLAKEVQDCFRVAWVNDKDPTRGFDYIYLEPSDYHRLVVDNSIKAERRVVTNGSSGVQEERWVITTIIGASPDLGVENLRGSGTIAGETSRAYADIFTLTYVSGRSVGIGAYLVRLGQRTIQKRLRAPIILTGFQALNKLMGQAVYASNQQLGGPGIMHNNGITHVAVDNDLDGCTSILEWLSFVPRTAGGPLPLTPPDLLRLSDVVERDIGFMPQPSKPYDPRHLLGGVVGAATDGGESEWLSGFFDRGSVVESLASWAKSVCVARARLGGIPVGVIITESRTTTKTVPADPASPETREQVTNQAGCVWFPDSASKTARAIRDFKGEGLPLFIFANWRGFSGGQRDMFDEVLKFGADIVDALVDFSAPVFVYIPPAAELRGGAWAVLDPTINTDCMEMFAAPTSRGGVLEPAGVASIKYRENALRKTAQRLDAELATLEAEKHAAPGSTSAQLKVAIAEREQKLLPVYRQVSHHFADLHDTPGRMEAKGVISQIVPWDQARPFFYWRLRRRLAEQSLVGRVRRAQPSLRADQAKRVMQAWYGETSNQLRNAARAGGAKWAEAWRNDKRVLAWLENPRSEQNIVRRLAALHKKHISMQVAAMGSESPGAVVAGVLAMVRSLPPQQREQTLAALRSGVIFGQRSSGARAAW